MLHMKHLKYFKEQNQFDLEEIREVCDTCFAYLYDKGFSIDIADNKISIVKNNDYYFYWTEIKDSFLSLMATININEVKMSYYQPSHIRTKQKFVVYKDNPSWDSQSLDNLEEMLNRDGAYGRRSRISEIIVYLK